jgi:hypothetical protein
MRSAGVIALVAFLVNGWLTIVWAFEDMWTWAAVCGALAVAALILAIAVSHLTIISRGR